MRLSVQHGQLLFAPRFEGYRRVTTPQLPCVNWAFLTTEMATEEPPYSPMVGPTKVNLRDLSREGEEVSVSSAEGVWQLGLAHRNAHKS